MRSPTAASVTRLGGTGVGTGVGVGVGVGDGVGVGKFVGDGVEVMAGEGVAEGAGVQPVMIVIIMISTKAVSGIVLLLIALHLLEG